MGQSTIKDMEHHTEHLIGQLGAEFSYLKAFSKDILEEEVDLKQHKPEQALKVLKKARGLVRRKIGRTERYEQRDVDKVLDDIKQLQAVVPTSLIAFLKRKEKEVTTFAATLVAELSGKQGKLQQNLSTAITHLEAFERGGEGADPSAILIESKKLYEEAQHLEQWIAGFDGSLKELADFEKHLADL